MRWNNHRRENIFTLRKRQLIDRIPSRIPKKGLMEKSRVVEKMPIGDAKGKSKDIRFRKS